MRSNLFIHGSELPCCGVGAGRQMMAPHHAHTNYVPLDLLCQQASTRCQIWMTLQFAVLHKRSQIDPPICVY